MENNKAMGMPKRRVSFSRRFSVSLGSSRFRHVFGVAILISTGFVCGHFLYELMTKSEHVLDITGHFFKRNDKVAGKSMKKSVIHASHTDKIVTHIQKNLKKPSGKERSSKTFDSEHHVPPKERDGASIKKDMSVQFREYVPRKVFVNCGGTFPTSLDLFLQTYPEAHEFHLYTFLPDQTYSLLYQKYPNHTLYTPAIVFTANTSLQVSNNGFGSMGEQSDTVDTVDLATWIKETLHQDDYVILKLESNFEKDIVERIGELEAAEWIDKFYSTSSDGETIKVYTSQLQQFNNHVLIWNNSALTYSDFDIVNQPQIPPGMDSVQSKCANPSDLEQFGLFLFAEHFTDTVNQTLTLLSSYAGDRKVALSFFLPSDFYRLYPSRGIRELSYSFSLGLYLGSENQFEINASVASPAELNKYRNNIVEASGKFQKLTDSILQFVMTASTIDGEMEKRICESRHVTIFNTPKHITSLTEKVLQTGVVTMDIIGRKPGEYLAIDLCREGSDVLALYMAKRFEPWLISAPKCQPVSKHTSKTT